MKYEESLQVLMLETTPLSGLYAYNESGVASTQHLRSRDNIYQALPIFRLFLPCILRARVGESWGMRLYSCIM